MFIGHLQPKIWRAEYLGSGDVANIESLGKRVKVVLDQCCSQGGSRRKVRKIMELNLRLTYQIHTRSGILTVMQKKIG